ncbi:hypothetical protein OG735_01110 [Streptomyces sp. NBC_01210]|uniref:hypothetical protein n=1 Tax=Streptomyces sp. NBC_01210 TaxID=2903774 RepID=UPI002E0F6064|nr:hypothetical protein OG735_01110 [Streptomyces sp. NBC_01210]
MAPLLVQQANAAPPLICLTGTLKARFADAEARYKVTESAVRNATWVLMGKRNGTGFRQLASGATLNNGSFRACAASAATMDEAYVEFRSSGLDKWRVISDYEKPETSLHTLQSKHLRNVTANRRVGVVLASGKAGGAFRMVDALNELYVERNSGTPCWTRHETGTPCSQLTVVWPYFSRGPFFDHNNDGSGTNFVFLPQVDAGSRHTLLHEAGHAYMYALFNKQIPQTDCPDPHYVIKSGGLKCAWIEGFADAVAAHTLGDRQYVWGDPTHDPQRLRLQPRADWEQGDKVQGRVGSALLDMWARPGEWKRTIDVMSKAKEPIPDFQAFLKAKREAYPAFAARDSVIARKNGLTYPDSPSRVSPR